MRLVGTHFSDFSKLAIYLFENVEKINIRGYNNIFSEKWENR